MAQRVLFTASTASHILHFHLPYLRRFRELGWEVDVACGEPGGPIPFASRVISLPFRKRMTAPGNFKATYLLMEEFARTRYDLVITHTALAAFFTRRALPRGPERPRVVNMVHGYLFTGQGGLKDKLLRKAEKMTAPVTDLLLTMNAQDGETARRLHLGARVESVPGVGVEFGRLDAALAQDKDALRRAHGIDAGAFVVLYAAEFSQRKNQALLIRALARLPQRVILVLAGQGQQLKGCKALARQLGVADRVLFPGYVADIGSWYAAADAAVSASRSEGLPFNIMEAMYAGLPIAATAVKGHTDLLVHGESGLLYPAEDLEACTEAVKRLLDDPALCARLGQAAHQAVLPYDLEQVLPQVMDRYLSLVPAPASAGV